MCRQLTDCKGHCNYGVAVHDNSVIGNTQLNANTKLISKWPI